VTHSAMMGLAVYLLAVVAMGPPLGTASASPTPHLGTVVSESMAHGHHGVARGETVVGVDEDLVSAMANHLALKRASVQCGDDAVPARTAEVIVDAGGAISSQVEIDFDCGR